jgi:thiamine biosynthesis protein ThiI
VDYDLIIIRYGEIGLKAKGTRGHFENILIKNIKKALDKNKHITKIKKERGRIYLFTNKINESIAVIQKIFGITSLSPAYRTNSTMQNISELSIRVAIDFLNKNKSFALKVTRIGTHEYTSQDVAIRIGNDLRNATKAKVDLTHPDYTLFIEIRDDHAYLFTKKIQGMGGLPLGTQGNTIVLFEDAKSLLAAWYLMKRGCRIFFIRNENKNIAPLQSFLARWGIFPHVITIDAATNLIYEFIKHTASEKKCDAIGLGTTVFNNTKQELSNITLLKNHTHLPVLLPLLAMDNNEIKKKCKDLGISL